MVPFEVLCLFSGHQATHGATPTAAARGDAAFQLCHFLLLASLRITLLQLFFR